MTMVATESRTAPGRLSAADVARYREVGYHYPLRAMSTAQAAVYLRKLEAHEAAHGKLQGIMRHKAHLYLTWLEEIARLPTILWDPLESTCRHASLSIL